MFLCAHECEILQTGDALRLTNWQKLAVERIISGSEFWRGQRRHNQRKDLTYESSPQCVCGKSAYISEDSCSSITNQDEEM